MGTGRSPNRQGVRRVRLQDSYTRPALPMVVIWRPPTHSPAWASPVPLLAAGYCQEVDKEAVVT